MQRPIRVKRLKIKPAVFFTTAFIVFSFFLHIAFESSGELYAQIREDQRSIQARRHFQTAFSLYSERNYELSIDFYRRAIALEATNSHYIYMLGLAHYAAGNTESAIAQWQNLLKINGQDMVLQAKINLAQQLQSSRLYLNERSDRKYSLLKRLNLLSARAGEENGLRIVLPTAINVNASGIITVMDAKNGAIVQLNGNGVKTSELLGYFSQSFFPTSVLTSPYDFLKTPLGGYIVSDYKSDSIVQLSPDGESEQVWNVQSENGVLLQGPKGLSYDGNGNIMVVDSGAGEVKVFNPNGELVHRFGGLGSLPSQLRLPSDVHYSAFNNSIYVLDSGNRRLQHYDRYGNYLEEFSLNHFENPVRVAADPASAQSLMLLDSKQLYRLDLATKKMHSVLIAEDIAERRPRNFLSMAFNASGEAYLGNSYAGTIDIYAPTPFLYENLNVQWKNADLSRFPTVIATVGVRNYNGKPIGGMQAADFEIYENGVKRAITRVLPTRAREKFRPVVLVEKSLQASRYQKRIQNFLRELFSANEVIDKMQIIGYGSDSFAGPDNEQVISAFSSLPRVSVKKLLDAPFFPHHNAGKALQNAITLSLGHNFRKAIVLFIFSNYSANEVGGARYQSLLDFAVHNEIPLFVVDSSIMPRDANAENTNTYLKNMTELSGGKYYSFSSDVAQKLLQDMQRYENGVYRFAYRTGKTPLTEGYFRNVEVRAQFQGLSGLDNKGGYPIP